MLLVKSNTLLAVTVGVHGFSQCALNIEFDQTSIQKLSCSRHINMNQLSCLTSAFCCGWPELVHQSTRLVCAMYSVFTLSLTYGEPLYTYNSHLLIAALRVNHWLVLITFLQHTDPILPHYRAPEFNFTRGALATLDRSLLGDLGSIMGWIGAHATHGISETHVLHHVSSKIPHYNA